MIHLRHLETNLTLQCTLSCRGCNHFVGMRAHSRFPDVTPESLEFDLQRLGRIAHADAWGALGGEPLLHPDLLELLTIARRSKIADRIEVWTNGMLIPTVKPEFWNLVDKLVVSAYPGRMTDERLAHIEQECIDAGVIFELCDEREYPYFRALLRRQVLKSAEAALNMYRCYYHAYTNVIDNGTFYKCCISPFAAPLVMGTPPLVDGISLTDITEESLREFLSFDKELLGCRVCYGAEGPLQKWYEIRNDPKAWLEASRYPVPGVDI